MGNVIAFNTTCCRGGGIECEYNSSIFIVNNTITRNRADASGAGIEVYQSNPVILNTILWADSSDNGSSEIAGACDEVWYCDIEGGYPGEGNIDTDPLFRDPDNGDFHLMATECGDSLNSPCIDAGDPAIADFILDCDWGLGYERSDMGAYGGQAISTDIREHDRDLDLPKRICLSQNYPNPFNSSTVISYSLPAMSYVTVSIYNVLGQLQATIFEGIQQPGRHSIAWNADDYPSGVYFARVQADERVGNIRMVLIK